MTSNSVLKGCHRKILSSRQRKGIKMDSETTKYQGDTGVMEFDPDLKAFVGTKILLAKPMTEKEWLMQKDGNISPLRELHGYGYLVIYDNGYRSWSPKDVFEKHYRLLTDTEKVIARR